MPVPDIPWRKIDRRIAIRAGAVLLGVIVVIAVFRPDDRKVIVDVNKDLKGDDPKPKKHGPEWIVDARGASDADGSDLAAIIAKVADGDTIRLRPGVYPGGLALIRPVSIIGETQSGGQVLVKASSGEAIAVRSKRVVLENLQLLVEQPGDAAVVSVASGAEVEMRGCRVESRGSRGVTCAGNGSLKAATTAFAGIAGTALQLDEESRGELTDCGFSNNQLALSVSGQAVASLKTCAFQGNGPRGGKGGVVSASGEKARLELNGCMFGNNPGALYASDGAQLVSTDCIFNNNGVASGAAQGLMSVSNGARATLTRGKFQSNKQGIAVLAGGTLEADGCEFSRDGSASTNQTGPYITDVFVVTGPGATATLRHVTIAQPQAQAISVTDGAAVVLEDCEISNGAAAGLITGIANARPARAEVKRTKFIGNQRGGVLVLAGSSAQLEEGELCDNAIGLVAQDPGTRVTLSKVAVSGNREAGIWAHSNAELTAAGCTFTNNPRGALSGWQGKSAMRAVLTLDSCQLDGSQVFAAGAAAKSTLVMSNCTFGENNGAKIYRETGAIVRQEPQDTPTPEPDEPPSDKPTEKKTARTSERTERPPQRRPSQPGSSDAQRIREAVDFFRGMRKRF